MLLFLLIALLADQLAKNIIQKVMSVGQSVSVFPFFYLTYTRNPGAAFGLFAYRTNILITITILVVVVMAAILLVRPIAREKKLIRIGMGLIIGGALSNLIDRLQFGMVIDYLDFRMWPVFNLADTAIFIGACLLFKEIWYGETLRGR
ncbi:MAG: Lipoprotein signal peptidase [Desulfotomaculum sp. 46_296]|nr:MAG: Lipoprotein signal peptidase [Desulfotomaculum sp. 46_296]HAU32454.1 signal peptidase II [Desulfotomaculum sp.]